MHPYTPIDLQDLLDERLPESLRSELAAHAAECPICKRELAILRLAKGSVGALPDEETPASLRERVIASLDAVDREARVAVTVPARPRRLVRFVVRAGLLVAAAVVLLLVSSDDPSAGPVNPSEIAADYGAVITQSLTLEMRSDQPAAVEGFFRRRGIGFPTRVFDLGMMGYQVVGGTVRADGARSRALFVYRSGTGGTLVFQMYEGQTSELPAADEVRENNGIRFLVHRQGNLTLVFWQEGDVICVLASDAAPEEVIALAIAKAVKV
jgi:anti-sigma factor RsiW